MLFTSKMHPLSSVLKVKKSIHFYDSSQPISNYKIRLITTIVFTSFCYGFANLNIDLGDTCCPINEFLKMLKIDISLQIFSILYIVCVFYSLRNRKLKHAIINY